MTAPFETPIVCPVLIGRERQIDVLLRLVDQTRTTQGQTALIAGEAGIGKSRLIAELKPVATSQGLTILQGRCFEPDRVLPYAPLPDQALRDSFVRAASAQLQQITPPTPRRAAKQAFDGLTAREREVAALLAQGYSNRALAEALVISERTIAKHVENILSKLGFSSRAQIAVWASEKRLAEHQT